MAHARQLSAVAARRWRSAVLCTQLMAAVLVWALPAAAIEVPALRGLVTDQAGLLTASERSALEGRLLAYQQKSGQQFALLTVPTLDGQPIEDFGIKVGD